MICYLDSLHFFPGILVIYDIFISFCFLETNKSLCCELLYLCGIYLIHSHMCVLFYTVKIYSMFMEIIIYINFFVKYIFFE